MNMPLAEWDNRIGRHLYYVKAGSDMIVSHVDQMVFRPDFETLAYDDLTRAESFLDRALARVREAKASYERKQPVA